MSKTHLHDHQHLKVTEIPGRGRSLVSSQPIQAGQILLKDSPILLYSAIPLKNGDISKFCSNCFRFLPNNNTPSSSLITCPSCSYHAIFCSSNCKSRALSSSHTPWVCQALNTLRYSPPSSLLPRDLHLQAYFLIAAYNLASISPFNFHLLLSLQGGGDSDSPPTPHTVALHHLIASLSPPRNSTGFSQELTAALLAKDRRNAFGLMEPIGEGEREVRAYGIYPKASLFNHDCLPNACRFDYVDGGGEGNNTDVVIRAIHDVPEGREMCLSYFPVNWSYRERQERLLEEYGFKCECDRCKVEVNWKEQDEEDDGDDEMMGEEEEEEDEVVVGEGEDDFPHAYFFVSYVCDKENCGGTLAPLPPSEGTPSGVMECNVCGVLRSEQDMGRDADGDGEMVDE